MIAMTGPIVCVCLCMYVSMFVCMYVSMYVYMYVVCIYVCMYVCITLYFFVIHSRMGRRRCLCVGLRFVQWQLQCSVRIVFLPDTAALGPWPGLQTISVTLHTYIHTYIHISINERLFGVILRAPRF